MKTLIVEDDYITSQVMQEIMLAFGSCDVAENGAIGVELFQKAINENSKYDVIFLDIMMPEMTGQEALHTIREFEKSNNILGLDTCKIIMTTALDDFENIKTAFKEQCEAYIVKPIDKDKILKSLINLDLL